MLSDHILSNQQVQYFLDNGYLALNDFIPPETIHDVNCEIEDLVSGRSLYQDVTVDVLTAPHHGRYLLKDVPLEAFGGPVKINELFILSDTIRKCNQDEKLLAALSQLVSGTPLICNSLNFLYGSQQPPHFDTWYMPPPVENAMVVASICLEDMTEDNGPLVFYPRSHKIPPFRFAHGGIHWNDPEKAECDAYVSDRLQQNGLQPEIFCGKKGDVFIWHAQLLHGGMPIINSSMTRRSLVTHYWRAEDLPAELVIDTGRGKMLRREHPSV